MVNVPLVVFSFLICGYPFLTGCGVVARLQAIDTNQRIRANASIARTAIEEHAKTQELFAGGAKPFSSSAQLQSQGEGLSFEDQARIERAKRQEEELAEHESVMGQIRRTHE